MLEFINDIEKDVKQACSAEHTHLLAQVGALHLGEPKRLSAVDAVWGLRLDDEICDKTRGAWLYSQVFSYLSGGNANVGHWSAEAHGFVSIEQISLSRAGAKPCFVATGARAKEALEAIKEANISFRPSDFDEDGYSVGSQQTEKGQSP